MVILLLDSLTACLKKPQTRAAKSEREIHDTKNVFLLHYDLGQTFIPLTHFYQLLV